MVVVKVIFSPYLRPTVKSPGDVGGPQPNPHEMAYNDERRATCVLSYWVQAVRPGYILFELDGCNEARVSHSFPEKCSLPVGSSIDLRMSALVLLLCIYF